MAITLAHAGLLGIGYIEISLYLIPNGFGNNRFGYEIFIFLGSAFILA